LFFTSIPCDFRELIEYNTFLVGLLCSIYVIVDYYLTQKKTERKEKKIPPIMFAFAKLNISSDFLQEFAMKINAIA